MKCPRDIAPDNSTFRPFTFASKSLTSEERRYSNIKMEALGILHGLERFCNYCFTKEVNMITDHKPLVAIFKNMLQHYHKEYSEFPSGYINSESQYYTHLDWIYSSQTGFPDTTIQKTKTQKYLAWMWRLMPYNGKHLWVHVNTTVATDSHTRQSFTMTKRVHHHRLARK